MCGVQKRKESWLSPSVKLGPWEEGNGKVVEMVLVVLGRPPRGNLSLSELQFLACKRQVTLWAAVT